jgi:predicted Rossmann fold nucleotide-binding protein DprA/Smf involved in DNA uptake
MSDPVLAVLDPVEPLDLDEIARLAGLPGAAVLGRLAALELTGAVTRLAGGRFVRYLGKVIT